MLTECITQPFLSFFLFVQLHPHRQCRLGNRPTANTRSLLQIGDERQFPRASEGEERPSDTGGLEVT